MTIEKILKDIAIGSIIWIIAIIGSNWSIRKTHIEVEKKRQEKIKEDKRQKELFDSLMTH